jgi:hypothetical protein
MRLGGAMLVGVPMAIAMVVDVGVIIAMTVIVAMEWRPGQAMGLAESFVAA